MPLFAYRCHEGHETELLRSVGVTSVRCECGRTAERIAVNRIHRAGPPDPRYHVSRYVEAAGEMALAAERAGTVAPDVIGIAQRRAAAMRAAS